MTRIKKYTKSKNEGQPSSSMSEDVEEIQRMKIINDNKVTEKKELSELDKLIKLIRYIIIGFLFLMLGYCGLMVMGANERYQALEQMDKNN